MFKWQWSIHRNYVLGLGMGILTALSIQISFSKAFSVKLHAQINNRWLLRQQFGRSPGRYWLHKDSSIWVTPLSQCLVTQRTVLNLARNWVTGFRFSKSFSMIHLYSHCHKWPHWLHLLGRFMWITESKAWGIAQIHGLLHGSILVPPTSVLSNMTNTSHISTPIIFSLR